MAVSTPTLSKAGQMRLKKAQGMSVGDIARLFGVSYHYAYNAVVFNAKRGSRVVTTGAPVGARRKDEVGISGLEPAPRLMTEVQLSALTEEQLLEAVATRGKTREQKDDWRTVRDELDRRDPSGSWLDRVPG